MSKSITKIPVKGTLVLLHGDEMAQIAFEQIIEQFIKKRLTIKLDEIDLSAENRIRTNGKIVQEAIDELLKYGVGVKNAGITVNRKQLDAFLKDINKSSKKPLKKEALNPLATKSPNGAIRKGIGGNITREDIPFRNLKQIVPDWIGKNIDVMTMDMGGLIDSFNMISPIRGKVRLLYTNDEGMVTELHSRTVKKDGVFLFASNDIAKVKRWSRQLFQRAVDEKRDVYVGLKDTVIPGYDGVMKEAVEAVFEKEFAATFKKKKIAYHYGLIDAQAAQMIVNPPDGALWGIPDNTSGRKMYKLVESLKEFGVPERPHRKAIARMSAGGGDQYGSFNMAAPEDGMLTVLLGDNIMHEREVKAGDPLLFMSNERGAIRAWVEQTFREADKKNEEIYFGLKREYMPYDAMFSDVIREVRDYLSTDGTTPPPFMVMTPSKQVRKMLVDPPINARYASLNLDGDIFSDIAAALGGSLATASSVIASPDGTMLFEAPHGTAPDLYEKYLKSKGKEVIFNASALLWAFANALEILAEREGNPKLQRYSDHMKKAMIDTVADGIITGDLKGKTLDPKSEKIVNMTTYLGEVEKRLDKLEKTA